jgi:hypothetical protein
VPYFAGDEFALKIGKELEYFTSWAISRDSFQWRSEEIVDDCFVVMSEETDSTPITNLNNQRIRHL